MRTFVLHVFYTLLLSAAPVLLPAAERQSIQPSTGEDLARLVDQLENPDYSVRDQASRELLSEGAAAIPLLAEVAATRSPEAATRALSILEDHLRSDDKERFNPADDALQDLADGERGFVAVGAGNVLARYSMLREERAVVAIRELGGTVTYDLDPTEGQRWWGPIPPRITVEDARRSLRPSSIVLRGDWKGGTEGLDYLRRLNHCRDLKLYVVRGSGVPLEEAEKLASYLPGLTVQERGALLGITGASGLDPAHCVVSEVLADGPAGRAGIRDHDIIHDLNGVPVTNFDDLIEKLKAFPAGSRVKMTVERANFPAEKREMLTVEVELGTWDLPELSENARKHLNEIRALEAERRSPAEDQGDDRVPTDAFPLREE